MRGQAHRPSPLSSSRSRPTPGLECLVRVWLSSRSCRALWWCGLFWWTIQLGLPISMVHGGWIPPSKGARGSSFPLSRAHRMTAIPSAVQTTITTRLGGRVPDQSDNNNNSNNNNILPWANLPSLPTVDFTGINSFFTSLSNRFKNDGRRPRQLVKAQLLQVCRDNGQNKKNDPTSPRALVEEILAELIPLSPIQATATSPKLQKKWQLVWTTEKEINVFLDWKLSNDITQTIDGDKLTNRIALGVDRGQFEVQGRLSIPPPAEEDLSSGRRTNFEFTAARLDWDVFPGRSWGRVSWSVPPVGQGWFDTVYLDDELRIDVNSRDDLLICIPAQN